MVRDAVRSLRAAPLPSAVAILSLAIGIGANTTVFAIANQLLLRQLPVEAPDRLAAVTTDSALQLGFTTGIGWNVTMWERLQPFTAPFDGTLAWYAPRVGLGRGGERVPVEAIVATGNFFDVLGLPVEMGRPFHHADDVRGGGPDGPVVVISDRLWRRDFGGAPTVIGQSLGIEGVPFTIVGVLPRSFFGLEPGKVVDIVLPLATESLYRGNRAVADQPRAFLLSVMLRLRAGQSLDAAIQLLRTAQPEIQRTLDLPAFAQEPVTLVSAAGGVETPASARPKYARALLILQAVTGLVLLVACANTAYLLLDRWTARTRECQVRIALGATRRALAWPVFIESAMLATGAGLAGVVCAAWTAPLLTRQLPVSLTVDLDLRVLAFTTAVSVLVAVVCAIGPVVRIVATDPGPALGTRGAATSGAWAGRAAAAIVVTQVASSLVIVLTAGLLIVTFNRLSRVSLGYDTSPVVLVDVDYARATDPTASLRRVHDLVELLSKEPGVSHAAASLVTPLAAGIQMTADVASSELPAQERRVLLNAISPAWFATYGTALRQGRGFHPSDVDSSAPVIIVNQAFVERLVSPSRPVLGEVVSGRTVVGVVDNQVVHGGFKPDGTVRSARDAAPPMVYIPLTQAADTGMPNRTSYVVSVRALLPSADLRGPIARSLGAMADGPAFVIRSLADEVSKTLAQERVVAWLSGFFGVLATLLAALGLYGVISSSVTRRRDELAIRLALGATSGVLIRRTLGHVSVLVSLGLLIGVVASTWSTRALGALLFGVSPTDARMTVAASILLALTGLLAALVPAARVARIDPAETLRRR